MNDEPKYTHSWKQVCQCCGVERRVRHGHGDFEYIEYFVDGQWTTTRPNCWGPVIREEGAHS